MLRFVVSIMLVGLSYWGSVYAYAEDVNRQTQSSRILMIGDSHSCQSFGRNMDRLLRTIPDAYVSVHASWGSSPFWWFEGVTTGRYFYHEGDGPLVDLDHLNGVEPRVPTPLLKDLLERAKPTMTLVELGANLYSAPLDHAAATVRQMAQMIRASGSECLWIGFANSRVRGGPKAEALYEVLQRETSPYCRFFDSRQVTYYPAQGGDGLHFDYLGAEGFSITRRWAEAVFDVISERP